MDWLDRISIWAIVLLIIGSFALIAGHVGEARPERQSLQKGTPAGQTVTPAASEAEMKVAKNLLDADSPDKAEPIAREVVQKNPYEARGYMLLGDILMRKQDAVGAIAAYRSAVDLNPDYLDRKTPLFQGKKLKIAAAEALAEIDKRLRLAPGDDSLRREKKNIYYLQRKIAGSCS